ncbi:MAG: hypothetical protein WBA14_12765 [Pseudolabrys sp.]
MKLAKNRNDRVMVGMGAALAGVLVAAVMTSVISDPQFTELCSVSRLFGNSASAAEEPSKPRMFHAQPANGPVPLAHKVSKIVKTDGPISIVRDPTDFVALCCPSQGGSYVTDCFGFYHKTKRGRRAGAGRRPGDYTGGCG